MAFSGANTPEPIVPTLGKSDVWVVKIRSLRKISELDGPAFRSTATVSSKTSMKKRLDLASASRLPSVTGATASEGFPASEVGFEDSTPHVSGGEKGVHFGG